MIESLPSGLTAHSSTRRERGMNFNLEVEQEDDGRWLAEVVELLGAMAYGASAAKAMAKAETVPC